MNALDRARPIRLLVLDVDGVLTDGGLWYGPQGEALKRFDVRDGHGIARCREAGITCALLSARSSPAVDVRARELGIPFVLQGRRDKAAGLAEILALAGATAAEVAYVGDDLNDLPAIELAAFSACPADADEKVRATVHHVCASPGGHGAVREVCDLLLEARAQRGATP